MKISSKSAQIILFGGLVMACSTQAAEDLPRYKFKVGQELVYESSSDFQYKNGSFQSKGTSTFWVTRQNEDGSWHIVTLKKDSSQQSHKGSAQPANERRHFASFDITAEGRVLAKPDDFESDVLTPPFFPLATNAAEAQKGWEVSVNEAEQTAYRVKTPAADTSGQWVIETTQKGIFHDIYEMTSTNTIYFDGARGLIEKADSVNGQGFGFVGQGTGGVKLQSAVVKDKEWISQLALEADIYAKAKAAVGELATTGGKKDAAKTTLETAARQVKLPIMQEEIQSELKLLDLTFKYAAEDASQGQDVLNKPAAKWETTDLDGHKHALADYRGKVVALDFWYRGCGWCMRAMPQVKALTEQFSGQPVVILGMNTDRDDKDARFVVDKLKLNYTTLKAEGLPEKYGVQGFPTFIVIDPQGIVRARHVGYSATLREDMARTINGLLKDAPKDLAK